MEDNPIVRGSEKPRKTVRETIKKDLHFNDLAFDETQWCHFSFDLCG